MLRLLRVRLFLGHEVHIATQQGKTAGVLLTGSNNSRCVAHKTSKGRPWIGCKSLHSRTSWGKILKLARAGHYCRFTDCTTQTPTMDSLFQSHPFRSFANLGSCPSEQSSGLASGVPFVRNPGEVEPNPSWLKT